MKTILFLDVENMGGKNIRTFIDGIIKEYNPSKKLMVYARKSSLSLHFRKNLNGWNIVKCKPGPDAADKVIQQHMAKAAKSKDVERVILITNDHGFAAACRNVIAAGKQLLLFVCDGLKLVRKIAANITQQFSVLKICRPPQEEVSSVFLKMRDGTLREVPFENGMSLTKFCRQIIAMGLHRKHMVKWLNECMLTVKDHHVFVDDSCFWANDPTEILFQGVSETPEFLY